MNTSLVEQISKLLAARLQLEENELELQAYIGEKVPRLLLCTFDVSEQAIQAIYELRKSVLVGVKFLGVDLVQFQNHDASLQYQKFLVDYFTAVENLENLSSRYERKSAPNITLRSELELLLNIEWGNLLKKIEIERGIKICGPPEPLGIDNYMRHTDFTKQSLNKSHGFWHWLWMWLTWSETKTGGYKSTSSYWIAQFQEKWQNRIVALQPLIKDEEEKINEKSNDKINDRLQNGIMYASRANKAKPAGLAEPSAVDDVRTSPAASPLSLP